MNARDRFRFMAQAKQADRPAFDVPDLNDAIGEYFRCKMAIEEATAKLNAAKARIFPVADALRREASQAAGKAIASIRLNGDSLYVTQCRYAPIPDDLSETIRAAFPTRFDEFFATSLNVTLRDASSADESVLAHLLDRLGTDFVARHFDVQHRLQVKAAFHEAYATAAEVHEAALPLLNRQVIKPVAPYLRAA